MNKLVSIVLILSLSCQLVLKLFVVAWFSINRDYIAATLCENKDKPELVCCGKCVLVKKLNKVNDLEGKQQKNNQEKAEQILSVLFILPTENRFIFLNAFTTKVEHPTLPKIYRFAFEENVFHPPCSFSA